MCLLCELPYIFRLRARGRHHEGEERDMMDQKFVIEFLLECVFPGIRKQIQDKNRDKMIQSVVDKAHRDTMIGARFKSNKSTKSYCDQTEYYKNRVVDLVKHDSEEISGRKIIRRIIETNDYEADIGVVQKLVNMTIKYLYVIEMCGYAGKDCFSYTIDISDCDCPLDRNILGCLLRDNGRSHTAWTKLRDCDGEYYSIQDEIEIITHGLNLKYDFINWGLY